MVKELANHVCIYLEHSYHVSDGESFTSAVYKSFNFFLEWDLKSRRAVCMYRYMYLVLLAQYFFSFILLSVFCTVANKSIYI